MKLNGFKTIKPTPDYVVLKIKVSKAANLTLSTGGIITGTPKEGESTDRLDFVVHDIGVNVKDVNFKIGDRVIVNDYDMKFVANSDNEFAADFVKYVITKPGSIMAVVE